MIQLTPARLAKAMTLAPSTSEDWCPLLTEAMDRFEIDSTARATMFLAQLDHESGHLTRMEENLRYSAKRLMEIFRKYFPSDELCQAYAGQPERIANRVYGGRMGNGPEASGDGWRYRGRGLIQLTGKDNYRTAGLGLGLPLVTQPELVVQPRVAALTAAWYWSHRKCSPLADAGDFVGVTRKINGGVVGLGDRKAAWQRVQEAFAD